MTEIQDTHKPYDLIQTLADDLGANLAIPDDAPIETLRDQMKMLHYINTLMIKESMPNPNDPFSSSKHNTHRISLALKAQNQFCRSLLIMGRADEKQKFQNEMKDSTVL